MKKLVQTGGISVGIGVLILVVVYFLVGGNMQVLTGAANYEQKQEEITASNIKALVIDTSSLDVEIIGSNRDTILIEYAENNSEKVEISTDNQTVTIHDSYPQYWFNFNFLRIFNRQKLVVHVPQNQLDTLTNQHTSSSVTIRDVAFKEQMDIGLTSGELTLENVQSKQMYLQATSGELVLKDVQAADSLDLNITSGSIALERVMTDRHIQIGGTSGSVEGTIVGKRTDFDIITDITSGSSNLSSQNNQGSKTLDVTFTSGSIELDFVE